MTRAGQEILAIVKEARKSRLVKMHLCPQCGWPLDWLGDGTAHCQFDGWVSGGLSRR